MNQITEDFKKEMVEKLNIGHLPVNEQDNIIEQLSQLLLDKASFALMREVPDAQMQELDRLLVEGKQAEFDTRLKELVPNSEEIVKQEVMKGFNEYVEAVNKIAQNNNEPSEPKEEETVSLADLAKSANNYVKENSVADNVPDTPLDNHLI